MADATSAAPEPAARKRHHWLRALGWVFGLVILLFVALCLIASSPAFLKKQVLPRISKALNANVTVGSAAINPFSQIVLHDFRIQPTNQPALLTAREIRLKCKLFDFLSGNIRVEQAVLVSPVVQLVQNVDGTSNFDPLTKALRQNAKQGSNQPSGPPRIDIRKLILLDATFRKIQNQKAGTRNLIEVTNVDLTMTGLKNGGSGKLEFTSVVRDENNPPAPAMYGLLQARVDGSFDFALTPELNPALIVGDAHVNISQAAGSFSDFAKLNSALHCDVSATEFKTVALNFEKGGLRLGELRATGPYDIQKAEGRLNVELLSVDKQVLNLFGARYGIDFGSTTITSTNELEFTKAGAAIAASGQLIASKFQLSRTNESTPPLEVRADYDVSVDKTEKTALLHALNLTGTQDGRPLLRGELASPMTLAWGNATNAVGDSSLNVTVTRLNIVDWKSFAGGLASAGIVDLNLKLLSQHGGAELTFDATNRIENLTTQVAGQHITDATVLLWARGRATNLNQFNLREYSLQLLHSNQTAIAISGSGVYDRSNSSADLQVALDASLPRALRLLNHPDIGASFGTAELKAHVTQTPQAQTVTGNLILTGFTGKFDAYEFTNFGATMDLDVEETPDRLDFHKVTGSLAGGRSPNGNFDLTGTYGLARGPSHFTVNFSDFNQDALRPLLLPLLGDKRLVSVVLNGTASAEVDPRGSSAFKADVQVSNLVVSNAVQQAHSMPLDANIQLDAATSKQTIDVHQLQVGLTPTARATNQFQVQGRVDMSKTNLISGNLKLTAGSLDLTSYYDLFNPTNKPAPKTGNGRNKPQNTASAAPPQESATNQLPFANFTVQANVKEFYLRELAATNFQAAARLDRSRILLKPFQLAISGSPVFATADVDMSVPGWKYAVTLNTTNVPFAPLWNTFNPQREGEIGGALTVYGDIKGTGTSGQSLQSTLAGNFHIGATNLNLQVGAIRSPLLRGVVEFVSRIAEIFENPLSAATLGGNIGFGKLTGSLAGNLEKSPIDIITLEGTAGDGRVILQRGLVRSAVFEATVTNGTITLAPVLTNSTIEIPIGIALSSDVAARVPYLGSISTRTNKNNYVKLPDFFSERGTIGNPKKNIDVLALTRGLVRQEISTVATNALIRPLQSIDELLYGGANTNHPGTNQPAATNQPSTNQPATNVLFNRFGRSMGK